MSACISILFLYDEVYIYIYTLDKVLVRRKCAFATIVVWRALEVISSSPAENRCKRTHKNINFYIERLRAVDILGIYLAMIFVNVGVCNELLKAETLKNHSALNVASSQRFFHSDPRLFPVFEKLNVVWLWLVPLYFTFEFSHIFYSVCCCHVAS